MKNYTKHSLLLVLFIMCVFNAQSQILEKTFYGYKIGETKYKTKAEILQLLENSPYALDAYMQSDRYRDKVFGFAVASVALLVISPFAYDNFANKNGDSPDFRLFMISTIGVVVGIGLGVASLTFNYKAKKKEREVVDLYNNEIIGYRDIPTSGKVSIGPNSNGLGLNYVF